MDALTEGELQTLSNIGKMQKAIDDEIDWYLAYLDEQEPRKRAFYFSIFQSKQDKRIELAKEFSDEYE